MKKTTLISALVLSAVAVSGAAETRDHYLVVTKDRKPAFNVTRIHAAAATATTRTFLIADQRGPLLRVDIVSDYENRKTVTTWRAFRGSRPTGRVVLDLPFGSTTAKDRMLEIQKHPELADAPVPVTISGVAGRSMRDIDASWRRADAVVAARAKATDVLGGELVSILASVRELAGLPMFADLNVSFGYVLPGDTLVRRSTKLLVAKDKRNCAFDASFDAPCR